MGFVCGATGNEVCEVAWAEQAVLPFMADPWEYFHPLGPSCPAAQIPIRKLFLSCKWSKLTGVNAQKK